MKVTGIIAEYNPFHNGHKYHIEKIRELTGADFCIVVMSGDFTQRGEPALMDKYLRAEMALCGEADLVLELPVCYACASAPYFAAGAIALLDRLGVTDTIGFGSECGQIPALQSAAEILTKEPEEYKNKLKEYLKSGLSYPASQQRAFYNYFLQTHPFDTEEAFSEEDIFHLLSSPNNLLGIEYCKALLTRNSSIKPITLRRLGGGYMDSDLQSINSSALAIRTALADNQMPDELRSHVPDFVFDKMQKAYRKTFPIFPDMLSFLLHYRLLLEAGDGFTDYLDISRELSDRISGRLSDCRSFSSFCTLLKTKELTYSRISRSLLHILLDIRKADLEEYRLSDWVSYARILGFRKSSVSLLSAIKANADLPLISKLSDARRKFSGTAAKQLEQDIRCAHIYDSVILHTYGTKLPAEMQREIIRI